MICRMSCQIIQCQARKKQVFMPPNIGLRSAIVILSPPLQWLSYDCPSYLSSSCVILKTIRQHCSYHSCHYRALHTFFAKLVSLRQNSTHKQIRHNTGKILFTSMSNLNSAIETQQSFVKISLWWQNDPHLHHTNTLSDQQPHTSLLYMTYGWWSSTGPEQPNGN